MTPTKGVNQTCSITTDIDHTRINGGITETCMNINGTMQWGKGNKNVNQTCMIATDINKSRVRDGINETCSNINAGNGGPANYQWHATDSNITQTCASAADLNRVRMRAGVQYVCDNLTGKTGPDAKYGWHKAGNISQTCTMDVDLSHTTITGDVNVTCVNTIVQGKPTVAWVPNAGQKCPTAEINGGKCIEAPAPILYGVCSITGEVYTIGAKACACSKTPAQLPAGVTAPQGAQTVWVPQDQPGAAAAVVPFQEAAQTGALPVTGDNTLSVALIGGGILLGGAVLLTLAYRRHNRVRFSA